MDANDRSPASGGPRDPVADPLPGAGPSWVADPTAAVRASFHEVVCATASEIASVRRRFAGWLAVDVPVGDLADDLVLAVYEAMANAVDHAYRDRQDQGSVEVTAHREADAVRITVADRGRWRTSADTPFRNHGLVVIEHLVDQVHIATGSSGTLVHLRSALSEDQLR